MKKFDLMMRVWRIMGVLSVAASQVKSNLMKINYYTFGFIFFNLYL